MQKEIVIEQITNLDLFLSVQKEVYKKDKNWISPINSEVKKIFNRKNPFWRHCSRMLLIARLNKKPVARVAIFCDNKNKGNAYFGYFESINDKEVVKHLFSASQEFLEVHNIKNLIGPINISIFNEAGILISGFERPTINMNYNPEYYKELLNSIGFKKEKLLYSYDIDLTKVKHKLMENKIKIRNFDMKNKEKELEKIRYLINESMLKTKHWQFHYIIKEDFEYETQDLEFIVDPNLILFAEENRKTVGVLIIYPDYNEILTRHPLVNLLEIIFGRQLEDKLTKAKVEQIAIDPKHFGKGIGKTLMISGINNLLEKGFTTLEYSWITEDNKASIKLAKEFKGRLTKKYLVLSKQI